MLECRDMFLLANLALLASIFNISILYPLVDLSIARGISFGLGFLWAVCEMNAFVGFAILTITTTVTILLSIFYFWPFFVSRLVFYLWGFYTVNKQSYRNIFEELFVMTTLVIVMLEMPILLIIAENKILVTVLFDAVFTWLVMYFKNSTKKEEDEKLTTLL